MSAVIMSPLTPGKRPFDAMENHYPHSHASADSSTVKASIEQSTPAHDTIQVWTSSASRLSTQPSPAPSTMTSLSSMTATPPPPNSNAASTSNPSPAKRRKLTPTEKLQREHEKQQKAKKRDEERLARDAKKAEDLETKRQRAEEREEKRRAKELDKQEKDAAKAAKELEKRLKDEAVAKKDAAQARMYSFFKPSAKAAPSPGKTCPTNELATDDTKETLPDGQLFLKNPADPSMEKSPTDYEKTFLPYSLPSAAMLAPISHFTWDDEANQHMERTVNEALSSASDQRLKQSIQEYCRDILNNPEMRGFRLPSTKDVIARLSSSSGSEARNDATVIRPLDQLRKIPFKILFFREDVRPPYTGTFTSIPPVAEARRLARTPCLQQRQELEYDYDSEEEWEEPEEGEDLDSEAGSNDDEEDGEMDDFLEDPEQEQSRKRHFLNADMQPQSSDLLWEDSSGNTALPRAVGYDLQGCGMEILLGGIETPIDPLSTAYWKSETDAGHVAAIQHTTASSMNPPRIPLQPRPNIAVNGLAAIQQSAQPTKKPGRPATSVRQPGPILQGPDLARFKEIVTEHSSMTKAGVLSALKVALPTVKNSVLDDTLAAVAVREGKTHKEKKWILVERP